MVKQRQSFTIDIAQLDIMRERYKTLGMTKSEYIRTMIERDLLLEWQAGGPEDAARWKKTRQTILSTPSLVAVLRTMKREFDSKETDTQPSSGLKDFSAKYGLSPNEVLEAMRRLTRAEVFIKEEDGNYSWTHKGVLLLPEFAPLVDKGGGFIVGSVAGALSTFVGDYDEFVAFVSKGLKVTAGLGDQAVRFLLNFAVEYLIWLMDFVFPLTGIPEMNDVNSWREHSLSFLLGVSVLFLDHSLFDSAEDRSTISDFAYQIARYKFGQENRVG